MAAAAEEEEEKTTGPACATRVVQLLARFTAGLTQRTFAQTATLEFTPPTVWLPAMSASGCASPASERPQRFYAKRTQHLSVRAATPTSTPPTHLLGATSGFQFFPSPAASTEVQPVSQAMRWVRRMMDL